MHPKDNFYMSMALELAEKGGRAVAPNPMVGAVIMKDGKVIGRGYHKKFGGPHAEVNAIKSVKRKADLRDATLYVTLEPCRHHGKTPPCQDLIEKVGISKVIIGSHDPFQGAKPSTGKQAPETIFLKGVLANKCQTLNKFYFTWVTKKRPYITVKIATSADGSIAGPSGEPVHFTSQAQDRKIHQLRADHQAILIGSNTALLDNPALTVRHVKGADPLRIILDSKERVPKSARVFKDKNNLHITKRMPLIKLMRNLAEKGIASVLVEPGPKLYATLKEADLIDELVVFRGRRKLKNGLPIEL